VLAAIAFIDIDVAVSTLVSCSNSVTTGHNVWPSNGLTVPQRHLVAPIWGFSF
jgi:hypothetical protein